MLNPVRKVAPRTDASRVAFITRVLCSGTAEAASTHGRLARNDEASPELTCICREGILRQPAVQQRGKEPMALSGRVRPAGQRIQFIDKNSQVIEALTRDRSAS